MFKKLDSSRFLHSIDRYAKKKRLKVTEEIRKSERERLERREKEFSRNANDLMMSEISGVKAKVFRDIYVAKSQALQKICKKKAEIRDSVLDLCKKKIERFTKSEGYLNKLENLIEDVQDSINGSIEVFFRDEDSDYIDKLKEKFPFFTFSISKKIRYGGLLFKIRNKVMDSTFDSALQEQKKWFSEHFYCKLL